METQGAFGSLLAFASLLAQMGALDVRALVDLQACGYAEDPWAEVVRLDAELAARMVTAVDRQPKSPPDWQLMAAELRWALADAAGHVA